MGNLVETKQLEYVQFFGISLVSKAIQALTKKEESHSAVRDREQPKGKQLIEQWPHGGGVKSWMDFNGFENHTKGTPYEVWTLEVPAAIYDEVMECYRKSARDKKEYDWAGILSFLSPIKDDDNKTFCSEEMYIHLANAMGWDRIDPATVHPGRFGDILQIAGAVKTFSGTV